VFSKNFLSIVTIFHLDDPDYGQRAYEEALRLNTEKAKSTDPVILHLNWAVSLANQQMYTQAAHKLAHTERLLQNASKHSVTDEVRFLAPSILYKRAPPLSLFKTIDAMIRDSYILLHITEMLEILKFDLKY